MRSSHARCGTYTVFVGPGGGGGGDNKGRTAATTAAAAGGGRMVAAAEAAIAFTDAAHNVNSSVSYGFY